MRRRGFVYVLVLISVLVLSILILAVSGLVTGDVLQVHVIADDTEHLYVADAVLAREVSRLKAAPWTARWYLTRGDPVGGVIDRGNYHGAETWEAVQDVLDQKKQVRPGLVDAFVRVTHAGTAASYAARFEVRAASLLRPTAVRTRQWVRAADDVSTLDGRQRVLERLDGDEAARAKGRARATALVREAQARLAAYGANAQAVTRDLAQLAPGAAALEQPYLDELAQGDALLTAAPPQAQKASDHFAAALAAARSLPGPHAAADVPHALLRLASARMLLAQTGFLDTPDRKSRIGDVQQLLDEVLAQHRDAPEAPLALIQRAWSALRTAPRARLGAWNAARQDATARLSDLTASYGGQYLWDEDRPASDVATLLTGRLGDALAWCESGRLTVAPVPSLAPLSVDAANALRLWPGLGAQSRPGWSPDGASLTFDAEVAPGKHAMYTCDASGLELHRWTPDDADHRGGGWAPYGTQLAYTRYAGQPAVYVIGVDGAGLTQMSPSGTTGGAWTNGGSILYFAGGALWVTDGQNPVQMSAAGPTPAEVPGAASPGDLIAFPAGPDPAKLYVVQLAPNQDTPRPPILASTNAQAYTGCSWLPYASGALLTARGGELVEVAPNQPDVVVLPGLGPLDGVALSPSPDQTGTGGTGN